MSTERGCKTAYYRRVEEHIGRPLMADEVVHHKDLNRQNNGPDNLQILTRSEHRKLHLSMQPQKTEHRPVTNSERRLIHLLMARQQQLEMLDVVFAQHIGISQGHWSLIKNEKRRIGMRVANSIIARFPDLWREVQDAMFPREDAA